MPDWNFSNGVKKNRIGLQIGSRIATWSWFCQCRCYQRSWLLLKINTLYCPVEPWRLIANEERTICKRELLDIPCIDDYFLLQGLIQGFSLGQKIFGLINQSICTDQQKIFGRMRSWRPIICGHVGSLMKQRTIFVWAIKIIAWQVHNLLFISFLCSLPFCTTGSSETILRWRWT